MEDILLWGLRKCADKIARDVVVGPKVSYGRRVEEVVVVAEAGDWYWVVWGSGLWVGHCMSREEIRQDDGKRKSDGGSGIEIYILLELLDMKVSHILDMVGGW